MLRTNKASLSNSENILYTADVFYDIIKDTMTKTDLYFFFYLKLPQNTLSLSLGL